jgi:hypothetical protein
MKTASPDATVDLIRAEPALDELTPRHDTVLGVRETPEPD